MGENWTTLGIAKANQSTPMQVVVDDAIPEAEEAQHTPGADGQEGGEPTQLEASEAPQTGVGKVASRAMVTHASSCLRMGRATSEPIPGDTAASSSQGTNGGATSAAPPGWAAGVGSVALNLAVQDVLDKFPAHNITLQRAREDLLEMRASVQVHSACFVFIL